MVLSHKSASTTQLSRCQSDFRFERTSQRALTSSSCKESKQSFWVILFDSTAWSFLEEHLCFSWHPLWSPLYYVSSSCPLEQTLSWSRCAHFTQIPRDMLVLTPFWARLVHPITFIPFMDHSNFIRALNLMIFWIHRRNSVPRPLWRTILFTGYVFETVRSQTVSLYRIIYQ